MNTELMFSSVTDQWATPQAFFDQLNKEFHFTLDPCADAQNHKCDRYFTKEQDGLVQSSAIHPMGVALVTGCIKHLIQLHTHTHTHWLSCLFQHGQTPDGFMTTSTRSMKSASFVVG